MAESIKVPEDQFKAVMRALLSTPAAPAGEIKGKPRPAASRKPGPKKTVKQRH